MDPVLTQLDPLLDDDTLLQAITAALAQRLPRTSTTGRPSTPVEVILRLLVVKHLYGWSDEQTEHFVADSLVVRQCCRVYTAPVPDDTTLLRWAHLIQPATWPRRNAHLVVLAPSLQVTRGRKWRLAGTVVETTMPHPTDSPLLYESVRVRSRMLGKAQAVVPQVSPLARQAFRERTRSAKRQMQRLMAAARPRGEQAADGRRTAYERRLSVTTMRVKQAEQVREGLCVQTTPKAQKLGRTVQQWVPLGPQVIPPTTRRVLQGEAVPASEKVVRLFAPHTAIIRTGKPGRPTACGRVLWWDAVAGGIVRRYAVLEGHPAEDAQWPPSLDHHRRVFPRPPHLLAGDRGVHTGANERDARRHGVKAVVVPTPGKKTAKRMEYAQQPWFRRGRNWRAGIAGRSSGLQRRHTLDRGRYHGTEGMERGVGWGVMTHDLRVMAQAMAS